MNKNRTMSMQEKEKYTKIKHTLYLTILIGYSLYYYNRKSASSLIPVLLQSKILDASGVGLVSSAFSLSYCLSKFGSALLSDKFNPRPLFVFGLVATGLCNITFTCFDGVVSLAAIWFLNGLIQGIGWPQCAKLLKVWFRPDEIGTYWSLLTVGCNFIGAFCPLISLYITSWYPWQYSMILPGLVAITSAPLVFRFIFNSPEEAGLHSFTVQGSSNKVNSIFDSIWLKIVLKLCSSPFLWVLIHGNFLTAILRSGINEWIQVYLIHDKKHLKSTASVALTMFEVGGIFGSLFSGVITDKWMQKRNPYHHHSPRMVAFVWLFFMLLVCLHLLTNFVDSQSSTIFIAFLLFGCGMALSGSNSLYGLLAVENSPQNFSGTTNAFVSLGSSVGGVLAGYPLAAVAIFVALEKNKEALERKKANDFVNRRVRVNVSFNNSEDLKNFLLRFQHALHYGYNIESKNFKGEKWTYLNAFYFVGNIVTTIGFGHMSPETDGGRLFCIVFALFGIPLTALMLRSVGNRISEWIIIMIKQFDRRVYNREAENAELKSAVIAFCLLWSIILLPAIAFSKIEKDWGYLGSVYYCFVTFSTIGFGDLVPTTLREPSKVESQVFVEFSDLLYLVIGLAIMSSVVVAISGVIENKTQMLVDPMEAFRRIDMDNLNSVAVKKLGLKINRPDNLNVRKGTEAQKANDIPNGATNRRGVKFPNWYHQRLQERNSSDRIDHVGPAPVISIAKQKTSRSNDNSRSMMNSTLVKTENLETTISVKADSSICCHSTSPLPPPVFKSNKVTPTEDMPVGSKNGMVNGTFETLDELAVQTTQADFESDNDASKINELMNVSSATEEYELEISN